MKYSYNVTPGATLTSRLSLERNHIISEIASSEQSVSLLLEGSSRHTSLYTKVEQYQLNQLFETKILLAKLSGNDMTSRVIDGLVEEFQVVYDLSDEDASLLREGFWDSVQSGIGSFAGGVDKVLKKIKLKKEPKGWEQAQRVFQKIAEKEGNQVVKDLVAAIEKETKGLESGLGSDDDQFPVNKHADVFQAGVNTIASVYDSIIAAADKAPGDDGYMPVEVANEIIEQLRIIVNKYMSDTEREKGGMYASFGGGGEAVKEEGAEDSDEEDNLLQEEDEEGGEKLDADAEYEKIMRGQDSAVFSRMTSMKAPLIIAGTGAALGALGWLATQPWFQDWIMKLFDIAQTEEKITPGAITQAESSSTDVFEYGNGVKPGDGLAKFAQRALGDDIDLTSKSATLGNLRDAAMKAGKGNLEAGLKGIAGVTEGAGDPGAAFDAMKNALESGADDTSIWKLWSGDMSGHGGTIFSIHPGAKLKAAITKKIVKTITKEAVKTVVKTKTAGAIAGMMTGAGAVLGGIGIGAVVAGGTLAYIRHRAKKKSRMGVLNDLLSKLNLLQPKPVEGIEGGEETEVTLTLYNPTPGDVAPAEGGESAPEPKTAPATEPKPKKSKGFGKSSWKRESLAKVLGLLPERTEVEIDGLEGNEELEQTGGKAMFKLPSVPLSIPPDIKDIKNIPDIQKALSDRLPDLDLEDPTVTVTVIDKREAEATGGEEPGGAPPGGEPEGDPGGAGPEPGPSTPPVPVVPAQIAKGQHAVVVFDSDGTSRVWRILKKKTYRKYASDAKKSGDKDASKFASRYQNYDKILKSLQADGIFVNTDDLKRDLAKISSGPQGKEHRAEYTRTRKNRKTGKVTRRKSKTGGYTVAKQPLGSIADIRNNIRGANNRKPRGVNDHTVIYLVDKSVLNNLVDAGIKEPDAQAYISKALSLWAKKGKKPKIADIGIDAEPGEFLKRASLAEVYGFRKKNKLALVEVNPRFFKRVLRDLYISSTI